MEAQFDLPSGDKGVVIDTATAARYLGRALQLWRDGGTEPLFFGDQPRPEGVVISFDQWSEYEELRQDAELDRRTEQVTRDRIANTRPEELIDFDDMAREFGWDPDADPDRRSGADG